MDQPTTRDYLFHLKQGNYQAALDLGKELQLDADITYKAQWKRRCEEHGPALTQDEVDTLSLIKDDAWVASECLEVLVDQWQLQKQILHLGQARTEAKTRTILQQLNGDNVTIESEEDKAWLRTRLYFLQYLDRLATFVKIWSSMPKTKAFGEAYGQFRDCNLIPQAIEFARSENHVALDAIFMHHGQEVLPQRLFILSQIPETAAASSFDLPHVTLDREDLWLEEPWRAQKDPVEEPAIRRVIESPAPEHVSYLNNLEQSVQSTEYPASTHVIADWYLERARAMDSIGLSSHALEMLRYAQVMGVANIKNEASDYEWLCKYVYTAGIHDESVKMESFKNMPPYDIMKGLLSTTNEARIVNDIFTLVLPWLEICRKRQDKTQDNNVEFMMYRWLLETSAEHIGWCCTVLEQSKPTIPLEERIIKDDLDLSRLALAIAYSADATMEHLVRIFECLPIFEDLDDTEELTSMDAFLPFADTALGLFKAIQPIGSYCLTQMMDTLQSHLGSAEVLSRYHASVPLRWYLSKQPVESQRQLCIRMASQAAGGVESGGAQFDHDNDWRELLDDMLRLYGDGHGIFALIKPAEIMEIFYNSLLRCGRFRLAKELLLGTETTRILGIDKIRDLVIDAEHEFFDNADTGNMHTGNMKQARECLNVLPTMPETKKEMDLIEATHALTWTYQTADRPGISLMPIQVRQSSNRLDLISKLINTHRGIYRQHEEVLALARKLGYQDDLLAEVKVLAMLASAALVDEEYETSYKLCQATVGKAQSRPAKNEDEINHAAWQICFNLGRLDAYEDLNRRLDVLAMALVLTPPEHIHDVLTVWRKVDEKRPKDISLDLLSPQYIEEQSTSGWQGLLQSAKKHQWLLGDLLGAQTGSDELATVGSDRAGGRRKRDQLREMMGGWLFQ
ncbi:hypothetical protein DFQ28_009829 [Apophysomyces sp. BC1034]|nr:hypothetical protein DFQ30_007370 [Apophysomyces sp. BC1015]KAG0178826.1 hypothetical protein DFQ29_002943 [Apophysomyces sp. BC1021]KAG0185184.1 hypothetical protein DFQ28_009829 [Apophysomyces sp. BC1034]